MTNIVDDSETGTIPAVAPPICEDYTTKSECEAADCYWYDDACHSSRPITDYLPWILVGGGMVAIIAAGLLGRKKQ